MYGAPKPLVFLSVFLLAALGWSGVSFGQKVAAPRGELGSVSVRHYRELRIVDKNPNNWVWITLNVFEYLMELDRDGTLVPRLATSWRWLDDRTLETVAFVPYGAGTLTLAETSVTDEHWSVREGNAKK